MIHVNNLYALGINSTQKYEIKKHELDTIQYVQNNITDVDVLSRFGINDDYTFDTFKNFTYNVNNYNFRDNKDYTTENEPNEFWCFGCSFTYGVGVAQEYTWPSYINKITNKHVKNFGVGGCGPMTVLRLLSNWLELSMYTPRTVYILGYFPARLEITMSDFRYKCMSVHDIDYNIINDYEKVYDTTNKKIINLLQDNKIDYKIVDPIDIPGMYTNGIGRDYGATHQAHPGPAYHKIIAEYFIKT